MAGNIFFVHTKAVISRFLIIKSFLFPNSQERFLFGVLNADVKSLFFF